MVSLYAALFLYEDEQGRIQNRLEEWWVKLSDRRGVALSAHARFMRGVAEVAVAGFDSLFGRRLLSLQALSVSLGFSGISVWLCFAIFSPLMEPGYRARAAMASLLIAAVCGWMTTRAARKRKQYSPEMTVLLGGLIAVRGTTVTTVSRLAELLSLLSLSFAPLLILALAIKAPATSGILLATIPILAILCSFGCDIGFIAATRLTLKWCSTMLRASRIIAAVLVNSLLGIVLGLGPLSVGVMMGERVPVSPSWQRSLFPLGVLLSVANAVDVLVAMTFTFLSLLLLAHRLFWPLLMRPTYALADLGVARRRKVFVTVGIALLGYAGWEVPDLFRKVIEFY
jgi:hypothetical protein